ncbi:peroxiredoxin family protein [Bacillus testis]|uniref:peroxiredoxin family protein n=1 Tax=Bacillus testis TaxID=1622072 RepID=UPI00067EF516|nr:TlpA disulfide reductase family protein [Bacillus testis]
MAKKILGGAILVFLIALAIIQALDHKEAAQQESLPGLAKGVVAPAFTLKNLNKKEIALESYRGKKVILNFWATWCPPCKDEMPDLQKFYQKFNEDVEIIAINNDPYNDVAGFAKQYGLTFPIVLEDRTQVTETYQVAAFPSTYFIDEKGLITYKHIGQISYSELVKRYKEM